MGPNLHPAGPCRSSVNISLAGEGEFTVTMALFQDPNYTLPYEGATAVLPVESMLYVGALLERGDTAQFKLLLKHCYATPTRDRADPVKYFIIRNRYTPRLAVGRPTGSLGGMVTPCLPGSCVIAYLFWKMI